MKEGHALCTGCGREPESRTIPDPILAEKTVLEETLEKKIAELTKELETETNHEKQQQILKSINCIIETIQKLKK